MKTINLIAVISFGALSLCAFTIAILQNRFDYCLIGFCLGAVSVAALQDYKNPQR